MIKCKEVETKRDFAAFLELPYSIYKGNTFWVPPLRKEAKSIILNNPFFNHAEYKLFICYENNIPKGRIGAIIDFNFIEKVKKPIGQLGFFECFNVKNIANTLFEVAIEFLVKKGVKKILAPLNPSTNYECGLLIHGFNLSPSFMMPYNPPYYREFFEDFGFKKEKDLYAYSAKIPSFIPEKFKKLKDYAESKNRNITIRSLNMRRLNEDLRKIMEIYNSAWSDNWGFVPITWEEMKFLASKFKSIAEEKLVLFAERNTEIVGFLMCLPNYNKILKKFNGSISIIKLIKYLFLKRKIDEIRLLTMGIKSSYRNRGIDILLYYEGLKNAIDLGFKKVEFSWILEDNVKMLKAVKLLKGEISKIYRIYKFEI